MYAITSTHISMPKPKRPTLQGILSAIPNKYPVLADTKANKILADKFGTIYYLKITLSNGKIWYKLGYTTLTVKQRIYGIFNKYTKTYQYSMGIPKGARVKIIATQAYNRALVALQDEQYLHTKYSKHRNYTQTILANGNTELYSFDILHLDN